MYIKTQKYLNNSLIANNNDTNSNSQKIIIKSNMFSVSIWVGGKMCYQVGNIANPNRKENTVVFSIFEAKDSRSNLRMCLSRYTQQIKMLQNVTSNNKRIVVFMFGDYQFLCAMYGLSGANGTVNNKSNNE